MDIILSFFSDFTPRQIEQFNMLGPLYHEWNSKINVISRKDAQFTQATGVEVAQEGFVARLPDGSRVLFVHGDELCTLDVGYQRLKRFVRSRGARWILPRLPDAVGLGLAGRLRRVSTRSVAKKPAPAKQQQADEVRRLAALAQSQTLVCGHAHVFRDENLVGGTRWLVLDAFGGRRDVLELGADGSLRAHASDTWSPPEAAQA
jgi:UDP-2,3-diacylglucosamine pyrophosphatase LpxH